MIPHLASTMCLSNTSLGTKLLVFFLTEVVPKNGGKRKHCLHIMPAKQTGSLTPQYNAIVSCFVLSVSSLSCLSLTRQYCTGQDQSSHVASLLAHVSGLILLSAQNFTPPPAHLLAHNSTLSKDHVCSCKCSKVSGCSLPPIFSLKVRFK